jgi:copper chaperone CopZ
MGTDKQLILDIGGMTCGHCVMAVRNALSAIEGVKSAVVTLDPPRAVVTFDQEKTGVEELKSAVAAEGYTAV